MKSVRFYLEHDTTYRKRKRQHNGNVFAAFLREDGRPMYLPPSPGQDTRIEGMGAVYFHPDSAVMGTAASVGYLQSKCRRVSEKVAREIHPRLFERLDAE